ncbi:MAG: ATP-dependent zinc metalloprotease FtsH [Chloroflexi bacterium]|nr:ATP-dependent zinc metalloprotease FtsH [Chloroflexota bacterium]
MDEQPTRSPVPAWMWIIGFVIIFVAAQFWLTDRFERPEQIPLSQVAQYLNNEEVESLEINGNVITVELTDGSQFRSVKESNDLLGNLSDLGVSAEVLRETTIRFQDNTAWQLLGNLIFTLGPILLLIWLFTRGFRQMQSGGNNIFGFGRSRAKNLNDGDRPTVTFDDVAGVQEAKEEVEEVVQFLREPEKFVQVGARIPKGVLMIGPPGTGKTLLARAIAGEAGVPFFHISGSEFVEMFVGVGASRVRDLFNKAKEHAPSIVFVDEIDAVGRQRGAGLGGGHDEREQTLNQILVEMDGFSNETNVIVIAATNRADVLDPALLRPGRFDRKVIVDLPDVTGREAILKVHARGKPLSKDISLNDIARLTAGFAGADLENLMNEAAIFAARRNNTIISMRDLQDAFDRVAMGPERRSRVISDEEKEVVAYHEAGHAVVAHFLPHALPVQKVTIIPRGRAGGYTLFLPEDRTVTSIEQFEDYIAMALGGRAAEEAFFGLVSTGASGDLRQVTQTARSMIMDYGMSKRMGLRSYGEQSGSVFLGRSMTYDRDYSEDTAKAIDEEIRAIIDHNYGRAREIVDKHRNKMVRLAEALIEHETLDRTQFEQLMGEAEEVDSNEFLPTGEL